MDKTKATIAPAAVLFILGRLYICWNLIFSLGSQFMDRRDFVKSTAALGMSLAPAQAQHSAFWPGGARFVVSLSMQFETGAQPERGANGPWGNLDTRYEDMPAEKWYEYGFKEGGPRLLDV